MRDFESVYREYGKTVYCYLLSLSGDPVLAEELAQETMFRAFLNIGSFRGECKLSAWLCQIAKNLYLDHQKKAGRRLPLEEAAAREAPSADIAQQLADRESAERILQILHELDEPYKEVFLLHALGDVPLSRISRLFGKSGSWARVVYYRAKARIAGILDKEEER